MRQASRIIARFDSAAPARTGTRPRFSSSGVYWRPEGQEVVFEIAQGQKGPQATKVSKA